MLYLFPGVLYLQYGDETKQIHMPNEITSVDTVRALFVSAFPQQLTMKMLESPSVAVYVKDDMRNMYYELSDVRWGSVYRDIPFTEHLLPDFLQTRSVTGEGSRFDFLI